MTSLFKTLNPLFNESEPANIKVSAYNFLRAHRNWYAFWSTFYGTAWNSLSIGVIILSALTSILTAGKVPDDLAWLPTILSAISALFGTLLIQFRVRDMWQIREQGRIDCNELMANTLLMPMENDVEARKFAVKLLLDATQIERAQAQKFFSEPAISKEDRTSPKGDGAS